MTDFLTNLFVKYPKLYSAMEAVMGNNRYLYALMAVIVLVLWLVSGLVYTAAAYLILDVLLGAVSAPLWKWLVTGFIVASTRNYTLSSSKRARRK